MEYRYLPGAIEATESAEQKALEAVAKFLKRIDHPNVVHEARVVRTAESLRIEFVTTSSVPLGEAARELSCKQLLNALSNVAATLADLHRHEIFHGSLAPNDLLYTETGRVLISNLKPSDQHFIPPQADDDIDCLIEAARSLIAVSNFERAIRRSARPRNIDKHLKRMLSQKTLPTAADLSIWFASKAALCSDDSPGANDTRADLVRPPLRSRSVRKLALVAAALAVVLLVLGARHKQAKALNTVIDLGSTSFLLKENNVSVASGRFYCGSEPSIYVLRKKDGSVWVFDNPNGPSSQVGSFVINRTGALRIDSTLSHGCLKPRLQTTSRPEILE